MRKFYDFSTFIFCLFVLQVYSACSGNRDVILTGFVFQAEKLEVSYNGTILTPFNYIPNNTTTKTKFFHEQKQLRGKNVQVKATIDSGGIRLLDTVLIIPDKNRTPLISFLDPTSTSKREVFLADSDTMPKF